MWILDIIPSFIYYILAIVGLLGIFASFSFGIFKLYAVFTIVLSTIILALGSCGLGASAVYTWHKHKAELLQANVDLAEEKARLATSKIEYVYRDKIKIVKNTQVVVSKELKDAKGKIDKNCILVPEVIDLHNKAAQ
jgi:hypothetical protein